jgi:zinc and cadmium transporter
MPLGSQTTSGDTLRPFLTGIILHNIPIAVAFMSLMSHLHVSKARSLILLAVFALMTPLGMLTTQLLGIELGENDPLFKMIMAIVVGIFLHISTTILFETSENHRFNALKFLTMLVGVLTAWLLTI